MKNSLIILVFLLFLVSFSAISQEKNEIIQQRIEFLSEQFESEDLDLTTIVEQLNYYFEHPINLNSVDREELEDLSLLTQVQISALLLHREAFGKFITIYEIQSVPYWDLNTIRMILPFVRVDDKLDQLHLSFNELLEQGKFESFLRYQRTPEYKSGYEDVSDSVLQSSNKYYHGNPDKYFARMRFSYATNFSIGVTAEKDPGEEFFQGSQKNGFDFYSAHLYYRGGKYLRSVAVGDYLVQIGQGLNMWSGYGFSKSADVMNIRKSARSIKPYTSADETRFLRGGAVDLGHKNISMLLFASRKGVDASVIADTVSSDLEFVESINLSGFHRTNSEISRKDGLTENIVGTNLRYQKRNLQLGVASVYQGYDKSYAKDTLPYNQFDFRGKDLMSFSSDYSFVLKNINFFGEIATTSEKGWANLHGAMIYLDKRAALSVLYRNYSRNYQTFYNAGFAESSSTQNEKGIYTGLNLKLTRAITLNAYADIFDFPWLKYLIDGPSKGHEILVQPSYKRGKSLEIYFRFREQNRQRNSRNSDGTVTELENVLQRNYRLNVSYKISENFTLKSRVEWVTINRKSNTPEDGFLLYQDIVWQPKSSPLDISLRYALFDTDSYDSRIYAYESNALYTFSVPGYYYTGSRGYLLIRYSFLKICDLWVKYGTNIYDNRKALSSGSEEILGNRKSDITIQLRVKF